MALEQIAAAPGAESAQFPQNRLSLVVFSGDMDRLMAAFIIATGAAASGMDVTMFFTFWGLQAVKKPTPTGRSLFGRMLGALLRDIRGVGPSKMNFGGLGRWMFEKMMKAHNVTPLPELRRLAAELGVRMLACQMSMEVMEIRREDLIEEVQDVVGVAAFLEEAARSKITLFI
ncbi:DsrE/DsrF/DrsH-like family protein [Thermoflexus sp.]|uniref:DsrE/DsrF/DrsH-like family protein n=1 Tax=Thermoflexus sp. TaxID=1969742 RepID=UPI0035E447CF